MKKLLISFIVCVSIFTLSFLNAEITITIKPFSACTEQEVDQLADMRITYFREYPYLYEGTKEYERTYLDEYKEKAIDAFLIQAFDEGQLIGILTGCAFSSNIDIISNGAKVFADKGFSVDQYYYIGEAIIIPEYRNQKILPRLLYSLGKQIKKLKKYQSLCFLTVIRQNDDPLKPAIYYSPDELWEKLGCSKAHVICAFEWPTIMEDGSVRDVFNDIEFWTYKPGLEGYATLGLFLIEQGLKSGFKAVKKKLFN